MQRSGDTDLFLGDDVHIPHRCGFVFGTSAEDARKFKSMRQVNGRLRIVGPTYGEALRVTVTGKGWRRPSKLQPGDRVTLWLYGATSFIPAGYSQVVLDRDPVPGSVRVALSQGDDIEKARMFSVAGRVVSVPQIATEALTVFHAEIMEGLVESFSWDRESDLSSAGFTIVAEEEEPLS